MIAVDPTHRDRIRVAESSSDEVRWIDGTGNNLVDPELGSAGEQLTRVAETGDDQVRVADSGEKLDVLISTGELHLSGLEFVIS